MRGLACQERESHGGAGARTADTTSTRTVVEGGHRCFPACPARCGRSDRATAASRRMQAAKYRTLGVKIAAPAVVDSERLSPGRDRRRHPRQVQRCRSCLRERKITLPTDLRGRGIAMERAAPFRGGQLGARNPRRLERTGYGGSPMIRAGGLDSAPPICTLARFEVRASWARRSTPSQPPAMRRGA